MSFDGYVDDHGKLVYTGPNPAQAWADAVAKPPARQEWYREGETVELDGNLFRVKSVKPGEIRLKIIQRKELPHA